jgi:hypothetical protein
MHHSKLKLTVAALAACLVVAGPCLVTNQPTPGPVAAAGEAARRGLPTSSFDRLHKLIAPGPNDSQWMQVPWMPSSDIYAARKQAAAEGKPLLLWYMAGEPLGTC